MSFALWMVEGLRNWDVYVQIANDTGWLASQFERMPHVMNQLHAKLVTWLSEDSEKENKMKKNEKGSFALAAIAGVVIAGLAIGIVALVGNYNQESTSTCTVTTKDTITKVENGNSHTEKRVGTEECGVFTVNDAYMKGQTRSADLYYSLKEGHKYTLTYNGWRNGFTSSFPNITKAVEVK